MSQEPNDASSTSTSTSSPPKSDDERAPAGSVTGSSAVVHATSSSPSIGRRTKVFGVLAILGTFCGSYAGLRYADHKSAPQTKATLALGGKVVKVSRAAADKTGGFTVSAPGETSRTVADGEALAPGSTVHTDARTRARFTLTDGSEVVIDRASELVFEKDARTLRLVEGSVLVEAAHVEGAPPLVLKSALGDVRVLGTKLVLTATSDRANVEVLRGEVEVEGGGGKSKVGAGQEAVLTKSSRPEVVPATDMARRSAFGEALVVHNEDTEAETGGLGELRAKKPGKTDEKDRALRLSRHDVKIRIAGSVARTEVEEVFSNDTDDELEGLYRFPLPPGAQMERLALDVDGKLVEGEFVDASRAQAIWRGVIHNAAPTSPKPREEWVWVPGPWRDPALLEWKRGGRFELKIFPIPKHGSRRVVLSYTENVAPSSGVRRYTYPLPQSTASDLVVDKFHVDAKVVGFDKESGVRVRGYELTRNEKEGEVTLTADESAFRPSGDLVVEYGSGDKRSPLSAFAFVTPAKDGKPGERFATVALRPTLPKWTDVRPRDQVIVVDSGRAMFGERFKRARRLAVEIAQEMDRRDRVTVIACDVRCKPLAAGFLGPGSGAAHDVDAFLSSTTPDGASDLVSAVGEASRIAGRDSTRDLRVTLLSSGSASAGHRTLSRVAEDVRDLVGDLAHTQVVAVPIGGDADVTFLGELAKGGGGVVVPYQPGERLGAAALDVLNASYGTVLRDATLTLPEGLVDAAPSILPPLRGGAETLVGARMTRDHVEGEVVLRGTVGGEPFEQKVPVSFTATDAPGNGFVPRIFAANRIADREVHGGDAAKVELVDLSKRFSVPSRFTSLLVLESDAMFQAFGVDRTHHGQVAWTGDELATGLVARGEGKESGGGAEKDKAESESRGGGLAADGDLGDDSLRALGSLGSLGHGQGGGGFGSGASAQEAPATPPAAKRAAPMAEPAQPPADRKASAATAGPRAFDAGPGWGNGFGRGRGEWMRRVWRRVAQVQEGPAAVVPADKLVAARAALAAAPDERNKHRDLARLLALQGDVDELESVLGKWNERDPLDADAVAWRSDLAARKGDREGALRILTGALASTTASAKESARLAQAAAEGYERTHDPVACALRISAAELRPEDTDAVARAVRCEEALGHTKSAERFRRTFATPAQKAALEAAITRVGAEKTDSARGDVVVSATWEGGEDLDLGVLDPSGARASVVSRTPGVRVVDANGRGHEELGLSNAKAGTFVVEIARATRGTRPVTGTVKITSGGVTKAVPFVLSGDRVVVGRVDARYEESLVSEDGDRVVAPPGGSRPFDRAGAASALASINVQSCARPDGPTGSGHVTVTFSPSGFVQSSVVDGGPFTVTAVGACIAARYRSARVSAFDGAPVTLGKSFFLNGSNAWSPVAPF